MYRAAYTDLQGSHVDTFGRNRRIVLTGKDYRLQTFGIMGANGAMVDQEATQVAAVLATRIPKVAAR